MIPGISGEGTEVPGRKETRRADPSEFKQPPNPGWRLLAAVYPFAAGAMAVNLFFLSLVGSWIGWPVLTPGWSVAGGMALGAPAAWAFARHLRRLMAQADGEGS